jgi:hypothetical protein
VSIESKHGVDEPGYEPPIHDIEITTPDETEFGALEIIGSLVLPVVGIAFAVMRFAREEVGKGFACLLMGALGAAVWLVVLGLT